MIGDPVPVGIDRHNDGRVSHPSLHVILTRSIPLKLAPRQVKRR
jgi:hypothetical protein